MDPAVAAAAAANYASYQRRLELQQLEKQLRQEMKATQVGYFPDKEANEEGAKGGMKWCYECI